MDLGDECCDPVSRLLTGGTEIEQPEVEQALQAIQRGQREVQQEVMLNFFSLLFCSDFMSQTVVIRRHQFIESGFRSWKDGTSCII